jgi:serine phosphatase RsbU (regulator of sigma subunit)
LYSKLSDFHNAYIYSSLQNEEIISNTESTYNLTKNLVFLYKNLEREKEAEINLLEQQSTIEQLKNKRQKIISITTGSIGILLLLLVAGLFHRFLYIRRTNAKINRQKDEIEAQRDEIELQRDLLIRQKKDITDSLKYAQRIQDALLPSQTYIKSLLSEFFILFKPRDIVSGDFYWIKEIQNHLVFIGADCTGHGVPGGFMSMLGVTLLNDLVRPEILDNPEAVLGQLREKIKEMLTQEGRIEEQKDGMDMAIAILDKESRQLRFAGANNPLYLIRSNHRDTNGDLAPFLSMQNEDYKLFELKGDNQPIGVHWEENGFSNHIIDLEENDSFYIFSDGIIDQYGGEHRKKFKTANFKKLLLSIQTESMEYQKKLIEDSFTSWKGDQEQIDDVCVIGVRI